MPFDYEANVTAVRNALRTQNTTTANPDLSSGLTTRVQTIEIDDPEVSGIQWRDLPAVYVRVSSADEDMASLGAPGPLTTNVQKLKNVTYEISGLYHKEGAAQLTRDTMTELYRLAENIEGVFQREYRLSNTAMWCNPKASQFGQGVLGDGTRIKGVLVTLDARYIFR